MKKTFEDNINDNYGRQLYEVIDEWKNRADDKFGTQIKVICEQTKDYFKKEKRYYTNPVDSFVWFYGMSGDKEKTYEKVKAYMIHSPELISWLDPIRTDAFYKALQTMQNIIEEEKKEN